MKVKLVHQIVTLVDSDLQFMLVPKCQSGYLRCNEKCDKNGHES